MKNIQGHQPQQLHHPLLEARLAVAPWHDSSVSRSHPNDHWTVSHDLNKPEDNNVYTLVITMQMTFKLSSLIHSFIHSFLCQMREWRASHIKKQSCIKYFQKVFQLKIKNYIFKYFNYFCQLLGTHNPKYKIFLKVLTKVIEIENTFRSHSINIRLINNRTINIISRLDIGTMTVTVQCMVTKKKHWKYWLNIIPRTRLNQIQSNEVLLSVT